MLTARRCANENNCTTECPHFAPLWDRRLVSDLTRGRELSTASCHVPYSVIPTPPAPPSITSLCYHQSVPVACPVAPASCDIP